MKHIQIKGVSIIICTYNGKDRLTSTLDYIKKIQFDLPWELILVDNASNDGTMTFVSEYLRNSSVDFKLLSCETPGKNYALWMAFESSQYEYFLICDDDNHLFSNYLTIGFQILEAHPEIGALGGQGLIPKKTNFPDWLVPLKKAYALGAQGVYNGAIEEHKILYGAGCFIRKDVISKLVDIQFNTFMVNEYGVLYPNKEDAELCLIIKLLGYELWYDDKLKFYHNIDLKRIEWENFVKLKKQQASVFPILEAYSCKNIENLSEFKIKLIFIYISLIKYIIISYISYIKNPSKLKKIQLIEYLERFRSFHNNWRQTIKAYGFVKSSILKQGICSC